MIYFFADNHFGSHPGKNIFENLPGELKERIIFAEDDFTLLESGDWLDDCELLILNMIGATCNLPHPGTGAESAVRAWCEKAGNMLLLHGSSAAFWQWKWWRECCGYRWVRPNDPDKVEASYHPVKPYSLRLCKSRHPLMEKLQAVELPADEIYAKLEQVSPAHILMDTAIEEGVFPQCFEAVTPWGGKLVHFIPGHSPEVTSNPVIISNICAIINYLEKK
jgi:hypothetical protein